MKNILKNQKTENENGRSMIEMLGVLAIIGVLSVGGIAGYSKAMYRYRLNKSIEQITYMAGSIRSFFATQKSYEGLSSNNDEGRSLLHKAKLVPEEMWDGNNLRNTFDSVVKISAEPKIESQVCADDPICKYQAFRIVLEDVSSEFCIDLITHDWREVNATVISITGDGGSFDFLPPVDLQDAVKACGSAAGDDNNLFMSFYFDTDPTQGDYAQYIAQTRTKLDAM